MTVPGTKTGLLTIVMGTVAKTFRGAAVLCRCIDGVPTQEVKAAATTARACTLTPSASAKWPDLHAEPEPWAFAFEARVAASSHLNIFDGHFVREVRRSALPPSKRDRVSQRKKGRGVACDLDNNSRNAGLVPRPPVARRG